MSDPVERTRLLFERAVKHPTLSLDSGQYVMPDGSLCIVGVMLSLLGISYFVMRLQNDEQIADRLVIPGVLKRRGLDITLVQRIQNMWDYPSPGNANTAATSRIRRMFKNLQK